MILLALFLCFGFSSITSEQCIGYGNVIYVSYMHGNDSYDCHHNQNINAPCKTINYALLKNNLSDTCVIVMDDQNVTSLVNLTNIRHFQMKSYDNMATLTCRNMLNNIGFAFYHSTDIVVSKLKFSNCGAKHPSTSRSSPNMTTSSTKLPTPWLSTAIFVYRSTNVSFSNQCVIDKSLGYGIVMYDTGGTIVFEGITVQNGERIDYFLPTSAKNDPSSIPLIVKGFASGGGIYIEYTYSKINDNDQYVHNNKINITGGSKFKNNRAERDKSLPTAGSKDDHIPFGRGGGLTLFFRGQSSGNKVSLSGTMESDITIQGNSALWGGGIFIEQHDNAQGNDVYVSNCYINNNMAYFGGGGVRSGATRVAKGTPSHLKFDSTYINTNDGYLGAGISLFRQSSAMMDDEVVEFNNCGFRGNRGIQGAAITAQLSTLKFTNVEIKDNQCKDAKDTLCMAAVYSYGSNLYFRGTNNEISGNTNSALVMDLSHVVVEGGLLFTNNYGTDDGGALAMYGHSSIQLMTNAILVFKENSARKRGGAMYVDIPGPTGTVWNTTQFKSYQCFIRFPEGQSAFRGQVEFLGNIAQKLSGGAVFAGSLQSCRKDGFFSSMDVFTAWKNFDFTGNTLPHVVTNPVKIDATDSDWDDIYPGHIFSPSVNLMDERGQSVAGTVKIQITPEGTHLEPDSDYYIVTDGQITLSFLYHANKKDLQFNVVIDVAVGSALKKHISQRTLKPCPFGFTRRNDTSPSKCSCNNGNIDYGITQCNKADVYILKGHWASKMEGKTHVCPVGYCRSLQYDDVTNNDFLLNISNQCSTDRDSSSTLCGQCRKNYSVPMFGEVCQKCSGNIERFYFIWILLVAFLVISILIMIVMWLNVDAYSGYLNAFLFYCQVVGLLITLHQQNADKVLSLAFAVVNMSGTGSNYAGICFYHGMDNLSKMALNYVFPTYAILFVYITCKVIQKYPNCYFRPECCFRSFAIISVVLYSEYARITFQLLHPIYVDGKWRLFIQADILFFKGAHLGFGILALFILVFIVIGLPILLLDTPFFVRHFIILGYLRPIFDAFQYCYRGNQRWFSAYYFIARAVLLSVYIFKERDSLQMSMLTLSCLVFLYIFMFFQPYELERMNKFDSLLLFNVAAISVLSTSSYMTTSKRISSGMVTTIRILMYGPFAAILVKVGKTIYEHLRRSGLRNARGEHGK